MDSPSVIEAHGLYGEFPLFVKMIDSDFKLSSNDKKKVCLDIVIGYLKWRTEDSGMLQSMGSQRVWHNLVTEQQHHIKYSLRNHLTH